LYKKELMFLCINFFCMLHADVLASEKKLLDFLLDLGIPVESLKHPEVVLQAFVHKSFTADYKEDYVHNERLEFLGDGILGAVVNKLLYINFPDLPESRLTLYKIALVREETLAEVARDIVLGKEIFISHGEEKMQGRDKDSILSDTLEAVIGSLYLGLGWQAAEFFVEKYVYTKLSKIMEAPVKSYKTMAQEIAQKQFKTIPEYRDSEHKISST